MGWGFIVSDVFHKGFNNMFIYVKLRCWCWCFFWKGISFRNNNVKGCVNGRDSFRRGILRLIWLRFWGDCFRNLWMCRFRWFFSGYNSGMVRWCIIRLGLDLWYECFWELWLFRNDGFKWFGLFRLFCYFRYRSCSLFKWWFLFRVGDVPKRMISEGCEAG